MELRLVPDTDLPLTKPENLVKENDKLDLSKKEHFSEKNMIFFFILTDNSDLIACTVHMKDK